LSNLEIADGGFEIGSLDLGLAVDDAICAKAIDDEVDGLIGPLRHDWRQRAGSRNATVPNSMDYGHNGNEAPGTGLWSSGLSEPVRSMSGQFNDPVRVVRMTFAAEIQTCCGIDGVPVPEQVTDLSRAMVAQPGSSDDARRCSVISSVDVDRWRINRRSAQTSSGARRKTAIVGAS
jgi:hypothetical protein